MGDKSSALMSEGDKMSSVIPEFYIDIITRMIPGGLIIFLWFPGLVFKTPPTAYLSSTNVFAATYASTNSLTDHIITINAKQTNSLSTNDLLIKLTVAANPNSTNLIPIFLPATSVSAAARPPNDFSSHLPDVFRYVVVFFAAWLLGATWEKFTYAVPKVAVTFLRTWMINPSLKEKLPQNRKDFRCLTGLRTLCNFFDGRGYARNKLMDYNIYQRRLYLRAMSESVLYRCLALIALVLWYKGCHPFTRDLLPVDPTWLGKITLVILTSCFVLTRHSYLNYPSPSVTEGRTDGNMVERYKRGLRMPF